MTAAIDAAGGPASSVADQFLADPTLLHGLEPNLEALIAVGGGAPVLADGRVAGALGVAGVTEAQGQEIADIAARSVGWTERRTAG